MLQAKPTYGSGTNKDKQRDSTVEQGRCAKPGRDFQTVIYGLAQEE
jgi:hypothetical protein